jgi:cell wall-associated NlpC family hydrolase
MSLAGFVQASGAVMGLARESFGVGGSAVPARSGVGAGPAGPVGSGRAAEGFSGESGRLGTDVMALGDHDRVGGQQVSDALAAAGIGRDRMDAVIRAAVAEVMAMGASTDTPQGRRALISAITRRLEETKDALDAGDNDAGTRAAGADTTAAGYQSVGQLMPGALAAPAPMMPAGIPMMPAGIPMMPSFGGGMPGIGGAGLAPLASLGNLESLFHPGGGRPQGLGPSAAPAATNGAAGTGDPAVADGAVRRALSWLGTPYSFGGGGRNGPSRGEDGVGFDCSGLVQYAYAGVGVDLPRTTYDMVNVGVTVPPNQIREGDIVLANWQSGRPEHVVLAISPTQVVEAPHRNGHVQISSIPAGRILVKRVV